MSSNRRVTLVVGLIVLAFALFRVFDMIPGGALGAAARINPWPGTPRAGTAESPDGDWTAKMYWVTRAKKQALVRVDFSQQATGVSYRHVFRLPSPESAQYDDDGELHVEWDEDLNTEYASASIGGQTIYLKDGPLSP